jgi:spermidine/putrescine-binding protein
MKSWHVKLGLCYKAQGGNMRRLYLFGLVVFSGLLFACQNKNTLVSKQLDVYSFSAYIPPKLLENFTSSTGVKVVLHEFDNNEQMLSSLKATPNAYDVVIATDYAVDRLVKQNALAALDLQLIPNSKNIDPSFMSPYFDPGGATGGRGALQNKTAKYSLPFQWGTTGIAYDSSKVKPAITSWADLWRSDLKGHLVVLDDPRELIGMTLLSLGLNKNSTNPAQLEQARQKLSSLAPGIVGFDSATPEKYLLTGQAWAGVVFSGNATLAQRQNPNIQYVFPSEGAGIWFDSMFVPKAAFHQDAALAFIDFVLEPAQSILITEMYPYSNPNRAALSELERNQVDVFKAYTSSSITNPPLEVISSAKAVKNVGDFSSQFETLWKNIKGSK